MDDTTFTIKDIMGLNIKRTVIPGTLLQSDWQYVVVTGISSLSIDSASMCRSNLLVRDIAVVVPSGCESVPGPHSSNLFEMIHIPAGIFLMGNNCNEGFSYSNELPQLEVYLSDYYIGKREVTRGEYRLFMNAGGYSNQDYWSSEG